MAVKMFHYLASDRYCFLALDEVQISLGLHYDLSLMQFVGNVSAKFGGASEAEKNTLLWHSCIMLYCKYYFAQTA